MMKDHAMIMNECAKGDSRYQKLLYEEYHSILMKVAFRYVSTYEQALELTQNGFLKIFHEFIGFRFDQSVLTRETLFAWIKRTFIVTLVDHIKSAFDLYKPRPIPTDIWKQHDGPFTDEEMMHIELIKILKGLPTLYRLVFNLYVIDGFTHFEIAGMLGTTVEGSKQNLIRAREYLNKSFAGEKYI
jgi:RNA polymerase sigma factor (sigma-70 family)